VADEWAGAVRVVPERTGTFFGRPMRTGFIYTVASVAQPVSVAYDPQGNLLIADERSGQSGLVWVVARTTGLFYGQKMTAGHIYVVAGGGTRAPDDGGPATSTILSPASIAISPVGDLLLTDGIRLRAISP
jgi:DNA-binding beta-propeller fold protein YncE